MQQFSSGSTCVQHPPSVGVSVTQRLVGSKTLTNISLLLWHLVILAIFLKIKIDYKNKSKKSENTTFSDGRRDGMRLDWNVV